MGIATGHIRATNGDGGPAGVRLSWAAMGLVLALIGPGSALVGMSISANTAPLERSIALLTQQVDQLGITMNALRGDLQTQIATRDALQREQLIAIGQRLGQAEILARKNALIIERLAARASISTEPR